MLNRQQSLFQKLFADDKSKISLSNHWMDRISLPGGSSRRREDQIYMNTAELEAVKTQEQENNNVRFSLMFNRDG